MRCALLLILSISLIQPYKILVYNSKFGHSNVNFFGNVADTLVDAGHDVTTLIPEIDPSLGDGTVKSKKIYVAQSAESKPQTNALKNDDIDWFAYNELDFIEPFFSGTPHSDRFVLQCRKTLEEPGLIERLKTEQFDVMIAENFDMCGIGISHLIKPKALINGAASIPLAWMVGEFGLPKASSYNPSPLISYLDVHSFWSRMKNLYAEAILYRIFYSSRSLVENLFKEKYGLDFPSLTEISSHAAYTIVNSEPLVDFATPTLARIVYVGGLGARAPKKVDKVYDDILNLRSRSILISFGSIVKSHQLKEAEKNSIEATALYFPNASFIWKYETLDDDFVREARKRAPNLHLFKWVPQNDLLADPRLTAFITHAGMGSTQEMMIRGKPGLFIPVFGDQPRNAGMMERSGLGRVFDKRDFSDNKKLIAAIDDLLTNKSYHEKARRIASMIAKKALSPQQLLIKTVEFAAEFGPSPALRPESYDMSWIACHNLDIIAFLSAVVIFIVCTVAFLLGKLCRLVGNCIKTSMLRVYSPVLVHE